MLDFFRRLLAGLTRQIRGSGHHGPAFGEAGRIDSAAAASPASRCSSSSPPPASRSASSASTMRTASSRSPPRWPACLSNVPFGLYVVADGMGGHQYGEVASNAAVRIIAGHVMRKFHSYLFAMPTQQPEESLQEIMEEAIQRGPPRRAAGCTGQRHDRDGGPGAGPAGDDRARGRQPRCTASIRPARIEQLTHDHSLVQRLEELGHLNKEEAAVYPHRNVLIRAVGQGDTIEADIFTSPLPARLHLDVVHRRPVGRDPRRDDPPRSVDDARTCSAPARTW